MPKVYDEFQPVSYETGSEVVAHTAADAKVKKVAHVKQGVQDRDHTCHWPGCNKQVPPAMWGCKQHWMLLPKVFRDRIWAAYRIGQEEDMKPSAEYLTVAREVRNWIKANAR